MRSWCVGCQIGSTAAQARGGRKWPAATASTEAIMDEVLNWLLAPNGFMAHGHCYLWTPSLIWLHAGSDALIAAAYATIPITLLVLMRRRRDIPFNWILVSFGVFILACGATHVAEIVTVWHPWYWSAGMLKALTAIASLATAYALVRLLPALVSFPSIEQLAVSNRELATEVGMRRRVEDELRTFNEHLEERIAGRTRELHAANQALAASEARYRAIVESAEEGIGVIDVRGRITVANPALERMLSREHAALIGAPLVEVLHGWQGGAPAISGDRQARELSLPLPDGGTRWIRLTASPLAGAAPNAAGPPSAGGTGERDGTGGVLVMASDISAQKEHDARLRASESRYRELFNVNPMPMWLYDVCSLAFIEVNDAAVAHYGFSRAEFQGMTIRDIRASARQAELDAALAELGVTGFSRGIFQHRTKAGCTIDVEVITHQLETEDAPRRLVMANDVSERVRAEAALARLHAELEQRVQQRTTELEAANRELESFCYSVSHDLRAPLRAIDGFALALSEDCAATLDAQGRSHLERVRSAARRMGQLIDDLLRLSRFARAGIHRQAVDLSAMAHSVVENLQAAERQRQVEVHIGAGMVAEGDPVLLRVVLENLLGNAWKFTSGCTPARIAFTATAHGGNQAWMVEDNGVGFSMDHAGKLFGPFQRLHAVHEFPGSGIGLASAKRIVNRHGGELWADSAPGQGARFSFTLSSTLQAPAAHP
jgi:PAS domain S-box-containing protein